MIKYQKYRFLPLFLFLLIGLIAGSCSNFQKIQRSPDIDYRYDAAIKYFDKKDYARSGLLLEELIPLLKGSAQAEQAQITYAYCHYYQEQLALSAFYFKTFYETFPRSDFSEEAMYMHARSLHDDSPQYYLDQTNSYSAIDALQNFLMQYPETKNKEECELMALGLRQKLEKKSFEMAKLYYQKEDFKAAITAFDNFGKDFSDSKMQEESLYLTTLAAYKLATRSTTAKQNARFKQAIVYYQKLADEYPTGKYLPQIEYVYVDALKKTQ